MNEVTEGYKAINARIKDEREHLDQKTKDKHIDLNDTFLLLTELDFQAQQIGLAGSYPVEESDIVKDNYQEALTNLTEFILRLINKT